MWHIFVHFITKEANLVNLPYFVTNHIRYQILVLDSYMQDTCFLWTLVSPNTQQDFAIRNCDYLFPAVLQNIDKICSVKLTLLFVMTVRIFTAYTSICLVQRKENFTFRKAKQTESKLVEQ